MIEITNRDLFGKIIADALCAVEQSAKLTSVMRLRWINAIGKAAKMIETDGAFMTWQEDIDTLLIWSQGSNEVYETNGVCQCRAALERFPCWHKAAKKLIKNYLEALSAPPVKTDSASGGSPLQMCAPVAREDAAQMPYFSGGYTKERKVEIFGGVRI